MKERLLARLISVLKGFFWSNRRPQALIRPADVSVVKVLHITRRLLEMMRIEPGCRDCRASLHGYLYRGNIDLT